MSEWQLGQETPPSDLRSWQNRRWRIAGDIAREQIGDLAAPLADKVQGASGQREARADGDGVRCFFRQPEKKLFTAPIAEGRCLFRCFPEIAVFGPQRCVFIANGNNNLRQRRDLVALCGEFVSQGVDGGTEGIDQGLVVGVFDIQVGGRVEEGGDAVDNENAAPRASGCSPFDFPLRQHVIFNASVCAATKRSAVFFYESVKPDDLARDTSVR